MALAGNATSLDTNATTLYAPANGKCAAFIVSNDSGSASNALVNIDNMHGTAWMGIPPGASVVFRAGQNGMGTVQAKAVSTATVAYGVVAILS